MKKQRERARKHAKAMREQAKAEEEQMYETIDSAEAKRR
jgi:F0F1-type ATP synthase membrane subunit b/b'